MSQGKKYGVAVIPGDGIGMEVIPEGIRVLEAPRKSTALNWISAYEWTCWDYYAKHGKMMPDNWKEKIG